MEFVIVVVLFAMLLLSFGSLCLSFLFFSYSTAKTFEISEGILKALQGGMELGTKLTDTLSLFANDLENEFDNDTEEDTGTESQPSATGTEKDTSGAIEVLYEIGECMLQRVTLLYDPTTTPEARWKLSFGAIRVQGAQPSSVFQTAAEEIQKLMHGSTSVSSPPVM